MSEEIHEPISAEKFERYSTAKFFNTNVEALRGVLKTPHHGNRRNTTFLVTANFEIIVSQNIIHSGLRAGLGLDDLDNVLVQGHIFLKSDGSIGFREIVFMQNDHDEKSRHANDFVPKDTDRIQTIIENKIKNLFN